MSHFQGSFSIILLKIGNISLHFYLIIISKKARFRAYKGIFFPNNDNKKKKGSNEKKVCLSQLLSFTRVFAIYSTIMEINNNNACKIISGVFPRQKLFVPLR